MKKSQYPIVDEMFLVTFGSYDRRTSKKSSGLVYVVVRVDLGEHTPCDVYQMVLEKFKTSSFYSDDVFSIEEIRKVASNDEGIYTSPRIVL